MPKYVDVILPLPLPGFYTYSLPSEYIETAKVGSRVIVPFGKKKLYTAVIVSIHDKKPEGYQTKPIGYFLDSKPILLPLQLDLWNWMSAYYMSTHGEVYKAALPSGLKLESETRIIYNNEFIAESPLSEKEQLVLDVLSANLELTIIHLEKASKLNNVFPVIKQLLEKGAILIKEEVRGNYKPKVETRVRLANEFRSEDGLNTAFSVLSRAPKQQALLMKYIELSDYSSDNPFVEVTKKTLMVATDASAAVLNGLIEKGILEIYTEEIGRLDKEHLEERALNVLNASQQKAFDAVVNSFREKNVCLLHGVTSSGKTEVYIHLIQEVIKTGKQVLYLLPEIALTTQITERLKDAFGNRLGVYHSKFPDAERVEIWEKQLKEESYDVILGVRSSIFLPFHNLGLIIIDEEHENSYKQQDPAPRYHARSAAIMLASMCSAKVLLGTATPSIETYYNATTGKYALVEMLDRYRNIQLPEIISIDIAELHRKKRMRGQFSPLLVEKMKEVLDAKEQVILFQNRRGFAPMVECHVCGWVPKCKYCDVSLTYHKRSSMLTCHYCGYTYSYPNVCPSCESTDLKTRGFGTEKVEDEIKLLFPDAIVERMDMDTTRTRSSYERIISDFEQKKVDILIGTQMVSKGLDFDHVNLVGILNADSMLNYPDFRAYERAFQLMAQVAGRAGRKNKRGLVLLQTKSLDNPIINQVQNNDYESMYQAQLAERQLFRYPPFSRLIYVYMKCSKEDLLDLASRTMADKLRSILGNRILGPNNPPVGRVQALFIKKIIIKAEMNISMVKVKKQLLYIRSEMMSDERFRGVMVYYDVDPV